ncbi:arsenate reductase (glutaredoxin) [Pseudoxanthomonas dokdonensis]|uniref:Arsenate reductase n=1 Tax=Pseudoxanthomonas dokdonensis TaxID=344882 RepID=A0A0R0CU75_9GAMM|nr:arsenate reductase (glutaredoxin) [Pseudoxanthomonas dokdonensis]KRG69188.1 arsenate reductase [Pseudoxanthomonas dokdonensis]
MDEVTIYHNPSCSKSRQTLQLLREHGIEPCIIHYLQAPPSVPTLRALLAGMQLPARELLRSGEDEYRTLGLDDPQLDDDDLLDAMQRHPRLINRPIVVTSRGARLCRPPERVLELL